MISRILTVAKREFAGYFDHATAYILLVIFLGINFYFYFQRPISSAKPRCGHVVAPPVAPASSSFRPSACGRSRRSGTRGRSNSC